MIAEVKHIITKIYTSIISLFISFIFILLSLSGVTCFCQSLSVPRWQPYDFEFTGSKIPENPFMVSFSGLVESPCGIQYEIPGFYDGNGIWKIRFAANSEGNWTLTTRSKDPMLDGKTVAFRCVQNQNANIHGSLLIDSKNPRHFIYEDGARYFLMGYECDWLWALDMNNPALPTLNPFLDKLNEHGFNHVILNAYAHDTGWEKGKTSDIDYGPPPMYPWEGSNEQPVFDRFNLNYWQRYDRMISALQQRGIIAHIMIKVYNKMVTWPKPGSPEDDLYFRWLIARYSAFSNVVWNFSKEAHNEKDLAYKINRFRFIRNLDPYHRLITNHDDDAAYENGSYNNVLDFRSDQHHNNWHRMLLHQRSQRTWPVVNVEFGYEYGPLGIDDKTYTVVQSPEEVCRRAWEICMAGGYTAYYYTYTAWDVIRPEDNPQGYDYFKLLRNFFETTDYWLMKPHDELVSDGYCLTNPGNEYIVFLNEAKNFTFTIPQSKKPLNAVWFEPFTGKYMNAGTLSEGTLQLAPPQTWGKAPVVLHVRAK